MYGFPDKSEFQFLKGQELLSVNVAQHSAVLEFAQGARITVEAVGRVDKEGIILSAKEVGGRAISWIGLSIVGTDVIDKSQMSILWSNGDVIYLIDDKKNYESFWFVDEVTGRSIVV